MSEDGPLEPVTPGSEPPTQPQAAAEPTQPVPTADPAAPGSSPAPAWPTPPPGAVPARSSTVAVPKWLILVLGGLAVGLLGFAIGWIGAPGDDSRTVVVRPGGFAPGNGDGFLPNPGNGGRGGNGLCRGGSRQSCGHRRCGGHHRIHLGRRGSDDGGRVGDGRRPDVRPRGRHPHCAERTHDCAEADTTSEWAGS